MGLGFLRRSSDRYAKLGKGRKKKQKWKKPTGRDNKMREKRKGYPKVVSIGYSKDKSLRGKINEKEPIIVKNIKELEKVTKNQIVIIGNVGKNKKLEIAKKAKQMNIEIHNLNIKSFLRKDERKKKAKQDAKKKEEEKKSDKKAKEKPKKEVKENKEKENETK